MPARTRAGRRRATIHHCQSRRRPIAMTTTANTVPAIEREAMEYDVVIVGGGPAGLAAAIRIKQRAAESGQDVSVVVLEKGSELGAHILSGAVMDPRAIDELIPDWKERGAPLDTPVTEDRFYLLTEHKAYANPHWLLPDCFINDGYYVVSLANVVRWLGTQAEELGVEVFAGFAAAEVLYDSNGAVRGVATGNMGVGKDGQPTANFQPGVELLGKYTLFAEGARGHLGKQVIAKHGLDEGRDPQTWGIGIKEVWEIDPAKHVPGLVVHSAGWPLDNATYGGGFLYHMAGQPGLGGPGRRTGLRQSLPRAVPGIPALQDAPAALRLPRRRQAHRLRRAGDQRQRPAVAAQARLPRRGAHRLRRGLPERTADQGLARSDQDRDAGRRRGVRRSGRRSRARRARRVSGRLRVVVAPRRAPPGTELQAAARPRARDRRRAVGCRPVAVPRQGALDAASQGTRPRQAAAGRRVRADRVSETRRRAHLRQAVVGVPFQHQPRREPAGAPDLEGRFSAGGGQPRPLRRAGGAVTARRASTSS